MKKQLHFILSGLAFLAFMTKADAQCTTTNVPQQTVMSGQTAVIPFSSPFVIHICSNAVAYDTTGSNGHEYHIDGGGQLYIKMNSTTTVYLKSGAYVNHYNDPGTLIYWAEMGATVVNVTGPPYPPCTVVSFPSSVCTTLGIPAVATVSGTVAFPNPADGEIQVMNDATADGDVFITDMLGRTVKTTALPANLKTTLAVAEIPAGVYFLTTRINGQVIKQEKIVIQH